MRTVCVGRSGKNGPRDPVRRVRAGSVAGKCADLLAATPALARGRGGRRRRAGAAAAFCRSVLGILLVAALGCGDQAVTGGEPAAGLGCPNVLPQGGGDVVSDVAAPEIDVATVVDVATAVDAGSGPLGAGEPLLVGEWRDCSGVWSLDKDGSWVWRGAYMECDVKGTASFSDGHLDVVVTDDPCTGKKDWMIAGLAVSFNGSTMALVNDAIRLRVKLLTHGQLTRKVWDMTSQDASQTQLTLCYLPDGAFFDGGYRTIDGTCQPLSCGGGVNGLKLFTQDDGSLETHIWLSCSGWCPCSSLVIATEETEITLGGRYVGGNCQGSVEGTFTAVPGTFPEGF